MSIRSLSVILDKEFGPVTFGGYLRSARTMKEKSQVEMADFLGISKSTLCDIEKGRQLVSIELAAKIAKRCRLSVELAVEAAIRDHLTRSGLNFEVRITNTK